MKVIQDKQFGYFDPQHTKGRVRMNYQQMISGYPIGIIYIEDVNYPMVPGNVNNAYTYGFPVLLKPVPNLGQKRLFDADPTIADEIIALAKDMVQREGIRALSSGCGFFGNFQAVVAEALDIPVALSTLVMVPWISTLIKSSQKIGVLTANAAALNENLFSNCRITDTSKLVVKDLRHEPEFSCILEYRGVFDNDKVKQEVVEKAVEIINENEDIGAILLECSDMPPYAYAIQSETQLPVFDFITLIKFLHTSVTQAPYCGWI